MSEQNICAEMRKISNVMDNFSLETENTDLKEKVSCLELLDSVGQCSNEEESALVADVVESADAEANLDDGKIDEKLKTQKETEQVETFRNWRKVMTQRNKAEEFWASGLIKYTIEEWEDAEKMDGEQILNFIKTNVDELTAFISSEESKKRFFLTFIKLCSMREVSKSKFQDIMQCFEDRGTLENRITDTEIRKFTDLYKEYKI